MLAIRKIDDFEPADEPRRERRRLAPRSTSAEAHRRGRRPARGGRRDRRRRVRRSCRSATHVTVVLRDDDEEAGARRRRRVRADRHARARADEPRRATPIPVTRSVFRKVVTERAAVIAADAPHEVAQTESIMGAQIRSTLGVPLWRGRGDPRGPPDRQPRERRRVHERRSRDRWRCSRTTPRSPWRTRAWCKRLRAAEERLKKENAFLKGREESRRTGGQGRQQEIIGQRGRHARARRAARQGGRHARDRARRGGDGRRQGAHRRRGALPLAPARQALRRGRTAPRCRRTCSRASSSATRRGASPARTRRRRGSSRSPTAARSSSTK